MPFICENSSAQKLAATGFSKEYIKISLLGGCRSLNLNKKIELQSTFMPTTYRQFADVIHNFQVLRDDIWIISFPGCLPDSIQELIWLLTNNGDIEKAKETALNKRSIFIEESAVRHSKLHKYSTTRNSVDQARRAQCPRIICSHLSLPLLPKQIWTIKPKIIYIARNPTDVLIDYFDEYHHIHGYRGDLNAFCDLFVSDNVMYAPYNSHIKQFIQLKDESNILFLNYNEINNSPEFISKIEHFLNIFSNTENLANIVSYLETLPQCTTRKDLSNELWKFNKEEINAYEHSIQSKNSTVERVANWSAEQLGVDFSLI